MNTSSHDVSERDYKTAIRRIDELESALIEVDMYLAALDWWHVGNIGKAGEVIGEAIGWERVRIINEKYAPKHPLSPPASDDDPKLIGLQPPPVPPLKRQPHLTNLVSQGRLSTANPHRYRSRASGGAVMAEPPGFIRMFWLWLTRPRIEWSIYNCWRCGSRPGTIDQRNFFVDCPRCGRPSAEGIASVKHAPLNLAELNVDQLAELELDTHEEIRRQVSEAEMNAKQQDTRSE